MVRGGGGRDTARLSSSRSAAAAVFCHFVAHPLCLAATPATRSRRRHDDSVTALARGLGPNLRRLFQWSGANVPSGRRRSPTSLCGTVPLVARTVYRLRGCLLRPCWSGDANTTPASWNAARGLDLSLTGDARVLVAHRDQLAVFDCSSYNDNNNSKEPLAQQQQQQPYEAEMLWTTQLPGLAVTAKISGDGQSIAVVLLQERSEDEEDAEAATDGVHTFERDWDDGGSQDFSGNVSEATPLDRRPSAISNASSRVQSSSLGILYKPGPFLVHSAPVTRLSFRGYGHVTSNACEQGNDLLLTYCAEDCSARIFGQNQWHPLTEWTTPSDTRVDWVRGISAFSLGDLESVKKKKDTASPFPLDDSADDIHATLGKNFHFSSIHSHPAPSTSAGAWVVEISFEDVYPALRLSRLTYLKRGVDDLNPTLIESVSSFLPANCVFRDRIFGSDDCGLSVEGIWAAWNPFLSETTDLNTTETLKGSAMSFLGLSSGPAAAIGGANFGEEGSLGGVQSPPSELRIVSSHALAGQVTLLEVPLLGDKALTSLELGYPVRNVLAVSQLNRFVIASSVGPNGSDNQRIPRRRIGLKASLDYDSSRLVAEQSGDDPRSLSITWQRPGTMSFLPHNWLAEDANPDRAANLLRNFASTLRDESLTHVPLVLPSVQIPLEATNDGDKTTIRAILWWPESKFDGSPLLVAVMSDGTIIVLEIAPPWSSLEPPLPDCGKPLPISGEQMNGISPSASFIDTDDEDADDLEYEVAITPDREYGLGLRLESQADGMCAIAGSYKRHPVTGEALPAEKSGAVQLGDELLKANDVDLENKPFDDIIAAVREVGTACGPGNPIRMRFRRSVSNSLDEGRSSFVSAASSSRYRRQDSSQRRRTMAQMLGVSPDEIGRRHKRAERPDAAADSRGVKREGPGTFSPIAGVFSSAIAVSEVDSIIEAESCLAILSYREDQRTDDDDDDWDARRTALLFSSAEKTIAVTMLSISSDCDARKGECTELGYYDVPRNSESAMVRICALHVVESNSDGYTIAVGCEDGEVHLVSMAIVTENKLSDAVLVFQSYSLFRLKNPWSPKTVLRIQSAGLLATMQPGDDGVCNTITVWSSCPRPGCPLDGSEGKSGEDLCGEYFSTDVSTEYCSNGNRFLDFDFICPGFLDATPALCTFSLKGAALFLKQGGNADWMPAAQISYSATSWSDSDSTPAPISGRSFDEINDGPRDMFPHLIPGLASVYSSRDEESFLRSDWHPDSLLTHVCIDSRGAKAALKDRVRFMLLWLCSESRDIPEGHLECPLAVAPLPILDKAVEDDDDDGSSGEGLMAALTSRTTADSSPENLMIRDLQSILQDCISGPKTDTPSTNSKIQMGTESVEGVNENRSMDLPIVLSVMDVDDLRLLWALGEVVLDPPRFEKIDVSGQLFLFAATFFRNVLKVSNDQTKKPRLESMPEHSTQVRRTANDGDAVPRTVASAGALGALLSSNQSQLRQACRQPGQNMTWSFAREHRMAFWVRSDAELARLAEEIGQSTFRESRDIMECALFFIIAGKVKKLRALSATDQSTSGRTFFNFLNKHDFSGERGRRAAEKNAYSLLRKNRYRAASAFFLLADPPFLKSSVETIATKMQDFDLAFLVGRLMESAKLRSGAESLFGSGGILGGGGGYAAAPAASEAYANSSDDTKFTEWKPELGMETRKLLVDRIIPSFAKDNGMNAVCLLWLGKKEEAAWFLSGHLEVTHAGVTTYRVVDDVSHRFFDTMSKLRRTNVISNLLTRPVDKANMLVNFASSPVLLKALNACSRVRFATSLRVSNALSARGVELLSMRSLLQFADPADLEEKENVEDRSKSSTTQEAPPVEPTGASAGSSIFDAFNSPPAPQKANPQGSASNDMQSSIFDDFAAPPPQRASAPAAPPTSDGAGGMQSSIFDDFAAPPQRKAPASAAPPKTDGNGGMQSSIFDGFDVPPPAQKVKSALPEPSASSGTMQSSIFDDFDVPKPQVATVPTPPPAAAATMQSSIFDNFDAAPAVQKTMPQDSASGGSLSQNPPNGSAGALTSETPTTAVALDVVDVELAIERLPTPRLWVKWRNEILLDAAARRLLRETASVLAEFHGAPAGVPVHEFYGKSDKLVSPGVSEVLQLPCSAESILGKIRQSLRELSSAGKIDENSVAQHAIRMLGTNQKHRTLFSVVLYLAVERGDLAEDVVRSAAKAVIQKCDMFTVSNDELVFKKRTRSYVSSQFLRREVARVSWQLESCLWLHRGGGFPLSGRALNETIVAVRIGLLLASWNRNFFCLESMIQCEPDCITDEDAGRPLWTSLRAMDSSKPDSKSKKTSSGGWEFLVECRRSQATELLRERSTGCFIIRPHSEDHGVFTLSFKTNLVPAAVLPEEDGRESNARTPDTSADELSDADIEERTQQSQRKKKVRKDDVVQHAIIRLSDSGFRCGSFGPFTSLITLLEAVSSSLPFKLRFDLPPKNRVITEEGSQTSPNAVLLRKLTLRKASSLVAHPPSWDGFPDGMNAEDAHGDFDPTSTFDDEMACFGFFLELVVLSLVRRQLSSVAGVFYDDDSSREAEDGDEEQDDRNASFGDRFYEGTADEGDNQFAVASRVLGPLLSWCRTMEVAAVKRMAPETEKVSEVANHLRESITDASDNVTESAEAIEVARIQAEKYSYSGDSILRGMVKQGSGVEFSTLRLVDGGDCTMVVLFSKHEAIQWLVKHGVEQSEELASDRLERMEKERIIEPVDLSRLPLKQKSSDLNDEGIRYRFVDPWEVEALQNREGETRNASLGRGRFVGFSLGQVATTTNETLRKLGDVPLLELWAAAKGGIALTKALASVFPPWERAASGDLQLTDGNVTEPSPFTNSIRESLYRNALYRRLSLPQRFLALVQVELLDLKNLTTPGGSLSMTAYALLRLKRAGSAALLTNKARTLDSAATAPMKLNKTSGPGPNVPASWGSVVRFRFPLPEDVAVDGTSYDRDRESLFKGPPCVLQVSVYEKKLLVDHSLGTADINTDGLGAGGQLEEWVPLRSEKRGNITWFARVRLTLRFELMCDAPDRSSLVPSVGLQRIEKLCNAGGSVHEDIAQKKRSLSSPDLMSYFENIV